MRRAVAVAVLTVAAAASAQAEARAEEHPAGLANVVVSAENGQPGVVPADYGRLVAVTNDNDVHFMFFEDHQGVVRIVLVGPRSAVARARNEIQVLGAEAFALPRREAPAAKP